MIVTLFVCILTLVTLFVRFGTETPLFRISGILALCVSAALIATVFHKEPYRSEFMTNYNFVVEQDSSFKKNHYKDIIEINNEIKNNRDLSDNIWIGALYDKEIGKLKLIEYGN